MDNCHCITAAARYRCRHASGTSGCDKINNLFSKTLKQNPTEALPLHEEREPVGEAFMQLQYAKQRANEIVSYLTRVTTRIHIGGSIRRECSDVGDIEIICTPTKEPPPGLMFDTGELVTSNQFKDGIRKLMHQRIKGLPEGKYMQFLLAADTQVKVDLFMPSEDDYYRILAIRTGSADFAHKVLANAWTNKGWCGVPGEGLRRMEDCTVTKSGDWVLINKNGEKPPAWPSELAFFQWLQLPWIEPKNREIMSKNLAR